jgi:alpha-L-glutamate ligase-like protein
MTLLKKWYGIYIEGMENAKKVVGMNQRNLGYVYPNNPRKYFEYANDKVLTKHTLETEGLSVPKSFFVIGYFYELQGLENNLKELSSFVIKPSCGSGGNGIVVIAQRKDDLWISVSGKEYTFEDIKKHVSDIIFGVFSFGLNDKAIIEERIIQDSYISELSPLGLADIRMINYKGSNAKAMLRIATKASDGKANLHQGGIGVAIDMMSGHTFSAQIQRENISFHPDTNTPLLDIKIPFWDELLHLCEDVSKIIPLDYLGIDIALSDKGPIILEVNARPGIEIQNISNEGMSEILTDIDRRKSR